MPMISSHVLLLTFGMASFLQGGSSPDDQNAANDASVPAKPFIVSVDDAMTYSADKQSPLQLKATLMLGKLSNQDETKKLAVVQLLLKHLEPGGNQLAHSAAEISIQKIGPHAIPSIRDALTSQDRAQQAAACHAIKAVGLDAIELLPQLIQMLESGKTFSQRAALYALQGFDDQAFDAIEPVAGCLESHDFNVHCTACRFLEIYGTDALPAENGLVRILETGNPSSRGWAAIALGAIGPTDKNDVVPMLIARLNESQAQVEKQRILLGLAHLERQAQRAVPTVIEFLNSRTHRVKPHAAYALYKITGEQELLVEVLSNALDNQNERDAAFDLIKRLDPEEAIPLQPGLVKLLSAVEEDVREKAVLAIGRLGPAAKNALPKVKELLNDADVLVQEAAAQTIAAITYDPSTESTIEVQKQ